MVKIAAQYALATDVISAGYKLDHCTSCPSTSSRALQFGKAGAAEIGSGIWFITDEQTNGRARQGRVWQSGQGNLTTSLLLNLPKSTKDQHILSFVAAIALADTIEKILGSKSSILRLKWPNDLLLSGAKLAGILLELQFLPDKTQLVAIGFGVNVKSVPPNMPYSVAAISDHCTSVSTQEVFMALSASWHNSFSLWNYGLGTSKVLSRWREKAFEMGEPVKVKQSDKIISGTYCDIDEQGRLILQLATQEKLIISVGDVEIASQ